jgi:hypothetical protein
MTEKVRDVINKDGFRYTILYWLALPILIIAETICKKPFDPTASPIDIAYYHGNLPADKQPYEEYLLILKHVYEVDNCQISQAEIRDALYA